MRFRLEKKHARVSRYSAGGFLDSFKRVVSTVKDVGYAAGSSSKSFDSFKEERSFQIQAELSRNSALLCEVMIPPR
jgi:hypothetical protein